MTALTEELLRERTSRLFESIPPEYWAEATDAVAVVICDACGFRLDLLAHPLPPGWTTRGTSEGGWMDLCRRCSQ